MPQQLRKENTMKQTIKTVEMTDKEITEALSLFEQAIRERPECFNIEFNDPITQNAYTSSSSIIGVYFPNSKITVLKTADGDDYSAYEVTALSKGEDGEYWLMLDRNDELINSMIRKHLTKERLNEIYPEEAAVKLDSIIVGYEERQIRRDLKQALENQKKELAAVENISYATKKDGNPFKTLNSNFRSVTKVQLDHNWAGNVSTVILYAAPPNCNYLTSKSYLCLPAEMRDKKDDFFTIAVIKELIEKHKADLRKSVAEYQAQLDSLHSVFAKTMRITDKYRDELRQAFPAEISGSILWSYIIKEAQRRLR